MTDFQLRPSRLKEHWNWKHERGNFHQQNWFRKISGENKERKTMREMWDNYLNFTRLDF